MIGSLLLTSLTVTLTVATEERPLPSNACTTGLTHSNIYFHLCSYRVTRRVFLEPVTSKLHLLYTKNLAGQLKTPKVIRISAMHANFSHSPVHSGPICFHMTKNLKLPSGTTPRTKNVCFVGCVSNIKPNNFFVVESGCQEIESSAGSTLWGIY